MDGDDFMLFFCSAQQKSQLQLRHISIVPSEWHKVPCKRNFVSHFFFSAQTLIPFSFPSLDIYSKLIEVVSFCAACFCVCCLKWEKWWFDKAHTPIDGLVQTNASMMGFFFCICCMVRCTFSYEIPFLNLDYNFVDCIFLFLSLSLTLWKELHAPILSRFSFVHTENIESDAIFISSIERKVIAIFRSVRPGSMQKPNRTIYQNDDVSHTLCLICSLIRFLCTQFFNALSRPIFLSLFICFSSFLAISFRFHYNQSILTWAIRLESIRSIIFIFIWSAECNQIIIFDSDFFFSPFCFNSACN